MHAQPTPTRAAHDVPHLIRAVLAVPGLEFAARLALAAPFLVSGLGKLVGFAETSAEMQSLSLAPAAVVAAAVILTQLGGSALFLTRRFCWLGAGLLAGFTVAATFLAHPFWAFEGPDRGRQAATFFEHLAIVGGFAAAALLAHRGDTRP